MAKAKTSKANLPAKVTDMTALQAIASFTPQEQKVFKELQDIIRKHNKDTLVWYWDLGIRVQTIGEDARKNKEHYGNNVLGRMSQGLGFRSSGPLYQAQRVVEAFGTKKSFTEFTKLSGEAGNTLSWGHLVMLAGISDETMRMDVAATALEQGWTVDMLSQHVAKLCSRKARGIRKAAPKTKIPTSVKKCIVHVTTQAEAWIHAVKSSWTGDAFNIAAKVDDIPTSSLNDALVTELESTRKRIEEMIESAGTMDKELAKAMAAIKRKLKAQAEADAAAELEQLADEDEEEEEDYEDEEPEESDELSPSEAFEFEDCTDNADEDDEEEEEEEEEEELSAELDDESDEDEDEYVNIGAERNAKLRAERAVQRARARARQQRGR